MSSASPTGDGTTGSGQFDLTAHGDIIEANKQHRQLIRQYGREPARRAFNQASSIVSEWVERGTYHNRIQERMHRFHGSGWRARRDDPTLLACIYLPAVALARLLVSPHWKALALHPDGNATFVAEVRRTVTPDYTWHPFPYWRYIEPLARTLLDEHEAEVRPSYIPPPSLWRSETIESGELCQDN